MPPRPPLPTGPVSTYPPHKLTVFELDRDVELEMGKNPRRIADLEIPHEVTIPRREIAAGRIVERHTDRKPIEINHCPGDDCTAIVLKG